MVTQNTSGSGKAEGVGVIEPTSSPFINDLIRRAMRECQHPSSLSEQDRTQYLFEQIKGAGFAEKLTPVTTVEIISLSNEETLQMNRQDLLRAISTGLLGEELLVDVAIYCLARIIHLHPVSLRE